jgi:hypothetical protein
MRLPLFILPGILLALGLPSPLRALPTAPTNGFETTFALDILFTRGNANKGEIGSKIETSGVTPYFERVRAGGSYAYGQSEVDSVNTTTAKRWDLFGYVRRPLEKDQTYTFVDARIQSDAVADLHYRVSEGGGAGIYLQKGPKLEWSIEAGLSWVFEETGDGSDNYPAIRMGERYEQEWDGGPKVIQTLELLPHALQLDNFLVNATAELTTVITRTLNLRTALEYRYQSRAPDDIIAYDLRLVVGVSCKY